jgi:hypothetical protein
MDFASLYDNSTDQQLCTANYTSVLTKNIFVEGQSSRKGLSHDGHGIRDNPCRESKSIRGNPHLVSLRQIRDNPRGVNPNRSAETRIS